jgi:nicotinamide-nucleotide adenylyltransferase
MDKQNSNLKQALFVGRFQPFHLGHLTVIKDALGVGSGNGNGAGKARESGESGASGEAGDVSEAGNPGEDRLIIVIGSAEQNHEPENPFTAGERYQMIEGSLLEEGISRERFDIIPVRNIDNFILWTAHVEQYIPPIYKVYTGSPIVHELYRAYGKYEIEKVKLVKHISGTVIREKMLKDDASWEQLVPARTATLVKQWRGIERLKMVSG